MDERLESVPRYRQHVRQVSDQHLRAPAYDSSSHLLAGDIADLDQHDGCAGDHSGRRDSDSYLSKTTSRPTSVSEIAMKRLSVAPAWQHKLSEKHLGKIPSQSQTVRYFDRSRQTRRVLLDCLLMWSGTAVICGALAGLLWYFETIHNGASRLQRYVFNTLSNGLLLVLGIAFAAQFKQYCEMMRWRFLASSYWTLSEFDEVLDCDSWRSAIRLITCRRNKSWIPGKLQLVAAAWVFTFVIFNVVSAALGLTYALENAESGARLTWGHVSVANYSQASDYTYWGQLGTNLAVEPRTKPAKFPEKFDPYTIFFQTPSRGPWWYRFLDASPNIAFVYGSQRSIDCTASCTQLELRYDDEAGYNASFPRCDPEKSFTFDIHWSDATGTNKCIGMSTWPANYGTYWFGNRTSFEDSSCGPRCAQLLVYQSVEDDGSRLWQCNSTVGQVKGAYTKDYQDPDIFDIADSVARDIAGAIGWSNTEGLVASNSTTKLELNQILLGENSRHKVPGAHDDTEQITSWIMRFTIGAIAAYEQYGSAQERMIVTGLSPSAPLVMHVKWRQAAPILVGIPLVQLLMLLGVVWYSGKAVILEPSYLTAAHLLYPVMQKLGSRGVLMTVDEMTEAMGPGFKVAYTVRPSADEPGHHNKDFVRDLALVEESEGFGYIRGKAPEGRYS